LGADMRFLDNRLTFTFTYYKTNTLNQYFSIKPSVTSLETNGYVNAGNIQNSGIEGVFGYDVFHSSSFSWNTSFNGAMNKSKVIALDAADGVKSFNLTNQSSGYSSVLNIGGSYGDIYGTSLLRDARGRLKLSGNGTTGSPYAVQQNSTPQFIGNSNPTFQLGWSNTISYKRFSFNFLVDGKFGGKVVSLTQETLDNDGVSKVTGEARNQGGVKVSGVTSAGQPVNTVFAAQAWYQSTNYLSEYTYSATVVRLREAALGYTWVPANTVVKSIRLSLTGRNLIYFYKKAPFDPEVTSSTGNGLSGIDIFNPPATRNLGLSLNVIF
jgi:hypothetical protein